MATTNVNTDANRLKTLQDKWLGGSRAALNLQDKIWWGASTITPTVTSTPTVNQDGATVFSHTIDIPEPEKVVIGWDSTSPTPTGWNDKNYNWQTFTSTTKSSTPTIESSLTDTSWGWTPWSSTSIWGSPSTTTKSSDKATQTENTTNNVVTEATAQYDRNKITDRNQYENQRLAYEAAAMETDTELKRFQLEREKLAKDEQDRINKKAEEDAANLKVLQDKERIANEASVASAQAKADAEERELQIANDIELQKSNVAFAKLWLNLSTAAATQAQQIYTTWVYNLSKLKTENAFKMANLQVEVAKVEFDHTTKINDIINKSSEDSYKIRKTLSDEVHSIKNSITSNRLERQQRIDETIDNYQKAIYENQNNVVDGISKANDALNKQVQGYYTTLKTKEAYNQEKIDTFVMNGSWYQMTPYKQNEYERSAWLPNWTISRKITGIIGSQIYKQAQELTWLKGITFSSWTYSLMISEAQNLTQSWVPFETAINQVISKYISESPEYQNALAKQRKDATIKASGWGGGASYWTAQPKEVYVDGKLQIVQFLPWTKWNVGKYVYNDGTPVTWPISDGGGGASYWTAQPKEVYVDGKLQVVQFLPWTKWNVGKYVNNDGTPVTWTISDVWENTADKKLSLSESIKAALAAKKTPTK